MAKITTKINVGKKLDDLIIYSPPFFKIVIQDIIKALINQNQCVSVFYLKIR